MAIEPLTRTQEPHWLNDEAKHWRKVRCRDCGRELMAFTDNLHVTMICDTRPADVTNDEPIAVTAKQAPGNEKGRNL